MSSTWEPKGLKEETEEGKGREGKGEGEEGGGGSAGGFRAPCEKF